jgi:hypothetical protein
MYTVPEVEAQRCDGCPLAIRRDVGVYCPKYACWQRKDTIALQGRLAGASAVAGVPVADVPLYSSTWHEDFQFSAYKEVVTARPACPNLRVVEVRTGTAEGLPGKVEGFPRAALVCQKKGNHQCACIQKRAKAVQKTDATKTTPGVVKAIVREAAEVVVKAMQASAIDPDLIRLIIGAVRLTRNYESVKADKFGVAKAEPLDSDTVLLYAAEMVFQRHVGDYRSPAQNRAVCAGLLQLAGLESPWEDAAGPILQGDKP